MDISDRSATLSVGFCVTPLKYSTNWDWHFFVQVGFETGKRFVEFLIHSMEDESFKTTTIMEIFRLSSFGLRPPDDWKQEYTSKFQAYSYTCQVVELNRTFYKLSHPIHAPVSSCS